MKQRGRVSEAAQNVFPMKANQRRITPPPDLSAAETKLFREIVAASHPEHFSPVDVHLLASYVQAILASRRCNRGMHKDPKLVTVWERATRVQAQLATKLRLSPNSRMDAKSAGRRARNNIPPSAYEHLDD